MVAPRTQPIFYQCRICKGRKGRGRNNGGKTCSAYECKERYKLERALAADRTGMVTAAEDDAEDLPSDKSVVKLHEILGERCCQPSKLKNKQRRSALRRKAYHQEYLVRGSHSSRMAVRTRRRARGTRRTRRTRTRRLTSRKKTCTGLRRTY